MIPILITSNRSKAGKVFFTIGLAQKLMQQGYKIGYIKPLGTMPVKYGGDMCDEDAVFIMEALGLGDPPSIISPFVLNYETQNILMEGGVTDASDRVRAAVGALQERDFVLIHGAPDVFEGTALGIDAVTLANDINAQVIMIEPWRGDLSIDTILGAQKLFGEHFCGGIFNKVPDDLLPHVRDIVKPFIEKMEIPVYGIFRKDKVLEAVTVKHLVEVLKGKVLCCEYNLEYFVENFSIGAMDVDSALSYFRRTPNKAVITGSHRIDIQLVAMETSTKCLVLTGGLHTNEVVISKAQSKGIPVISVETDTFTTVDRIERMMGQAMIREKGKVDRAKEVVGMEFDIDKFLRCIS